MRNSTPLRRILAAALAFVMAISLAVPAFAVDNAVSFPDVSTGDTFYTGILYCAGKGIVGGYADGTFRPANTVSRSNFTVMLSRAFYAGDISQFEPSASSYGSFYPNYMAMYSNGVLEGVSFSELDALRSPDAMNTGISRYDMARLMTNIMSKNGFSASSSDKSATAGKITDYDSIPSQYRDAVSNVYALGVIGGFSDGSFGGSATMNRGQGAAVIHRMIQKMYPDSEQPAPNPETPKPTTVNVTSTETGNGTAWMVPDNGYSTGYLNNGKPVTQANVEAMLADAEKIWPDGMTWTVEGASGNNYYGNKGAIADGYTAWQIIHGAHRTDANYACGGFACMLSDYIFGPNASNPCRKLDDNTQVRPGDIVIRAVNGKTAHVSIATCTVWYKSNRPGVFTAEGNMSNQIVWNAGNGTAIDSYTNSAGNSTCIIYTRYPD